MRRNNVIAIVVLVCSVGLLFGSLFLYFTDSPILHQYFGPNAFGGFMTVQQIKTGIGFWGPFWIGRNVKVVGILQRTLTSDYPEPYNVLLKDYYSNATIGLSLNLTKYQVGYGQRVAVFGNVVKIRGEFLISVEEVYPALFAA